MFDIKQAQPTHHLLDQAAEWISRVSEPLILIGSSTAQLNVRYDLIEFAMQLGIPVISTIAAENIIPKHHLLSLGTVDSPKAHIRCGFDWADLVITVGYNTTECAAHHWNPDGDLPVLHISTSSTHVNRYYQPKMELIGNVSQLLCGLMQRVNRDNKPASYFSNSADRGQIKVNPLSPSKSGDFESYTLQSSDQTVLMKVSAGAVEDLSVHHFRTNRLHVLQGTVVLVVLQNGCYEYTTLSDHKPMAVEIPPGVPHCVVNLSTDSCLIMNAVTQHGPADERDYSSLKPPFPYDIAKALQLLEKAQCFHTHRPILRVL
ncbi:MAG: hypothetical protein F6K42_09605 [Leptolyngbya sp. SIO1D8]|nr:hypothetical protein [Leptolyngbya sp. SIO1D8]